MFVQLYNIDRFDINIWIVTENIEIAKVIDTVNSSRYLYDNACTDDFNFIVHIDVSKCTLIMHVDISTIRTHIDIFARDANSNQHVIYEHSLFNF